jgi:hypothetical protein
VTSLGRESRPAAGRAIEYRSAGNGNDYCGRGRAMSRKLVASGREVKSSQLRDLRGAGVTVKTSFCDTDRPRGKFIQHSMPR